MKPNKTLIVALAALLAGLVPTAHAQDPVDSTLALASDALNEHLATPLNLTLVSHALVLFAPDGTAVVAKPAALETTAVPFPVIVSGSPVATAARLQVRGEGVVVAEAAVDSLVDGGEVSTSVLLENVPFVPTNSYTLELLDAIGGLLYASPSLTFWNVPGIFVPVPDVSPCPTDAVDPQRPIDSLAPTAPGEPLWTDQGPVHVAQESRCLDPVSGVQASAQSCTARQTTWSRQGAWNGAYLNNYGNQLNVNDGHITSAAFTRPWSWGLRNSCGTESTLGSGKTWGVADQHDGKTDLVGTGSTNYGFSLSYSGGGESWTWRCYGGNRCGYEGYGVYASNAKSFMKMPEAAVPTWNHMQNVNIPSTSCSAAVATVQQLALDGLATWLGGLPAVIATAVGYTVPSKVCAKNYQEITAGIAGIPGGGINVNSIVTGKKLVSGEHSWRFDGRGSFTWTMQTAVDMRATFNACEYCWTETSYTAYVHVQHGARVRDR